VGGWSSSWVVLEWSAIALVGALVLPFVLPSGQAKNLAGVAETHLDLSEDQRSGFVRYFQSADDLSVALTDVDVLLDGDQALVTFTRRDVFHDHGSGKEMHLEVRLSSVVEQRDGHWLLRGVKRSS
jgi:SnoaL-like domain